MSGLLEFTSIFEILCLAFWQVWWTNELVADTWLYVWCDMWLAIGTDRSKSSMLTIFSMFKVSSFWCHFWLAMAKCLCLSWPVGFESVCNHTLRFWAGPNSVQLYTMTRVSMGIWPQFDGGCEGYLYIYILYIFSCSWWSHIKKLWFYWFSYCVNLGPVAGTVDAARTDWLKAGSIKSGGLVSWVIWLLDNYHLITCMEEQT